MSSPPSETLQPVIAADGKLPFRVSATLFYAVMIMVVGQAFLFTILPPIGRQVGMADYQIGLVMSVHGLFMLFTGPMWGAASETWGRRRVMIIGSFAFVISVVMFGLIVDAAISGLVSGMAVLWMLVGSRALFALGAGAVTPSAMALAADMSSREMRLRAISMLTAATSTGAILGPSVSAFFTGFGLSAPFYIIAVTGLFAAIFARLYLPKTRASSSAAAIRYRHLLKGPILRISISAVCFMCGTYGTFSIIGFFVQDRFALEPVPAAQAMGLGLMCAAASNVFIQAFVLRRINRSAKTLIVIGVCVTILSIGLIWNSTTQWMFILAMMCNGLGQGFSMPAINTSLSLAAGPDAQGRLAGISTSTQAIAFLIAPASAAALYQSINWLPFAIGAVVTAIALILFLGTPIVDGRKGRTDEVEDLTAA
ncbi:MAG: MFS transporter [Rhodospirillaceae bacterium]|nr:MFS transporter [Rhodospirillaceae bacterium]MBT6089290.1 MFS transporter [Rhodospirillaceae bacterium]MBT6960309.1 MFS transporter [Rhodospirillaceae bacterium]